jgi:hypothetical protein
MQIERDQMTAELASIKANLISDYYSMREQLNAALDALD